MPFSYNPFQSSYRNHIAASPVSIAKSHEPAFLSLRSSSGLIVTTVTFAVFTDIFFYAIIVPVVPFTLSVRIGVPDDQVQYWVSVTLTVYAASLLATAPIWGYMADRFRNRKVPMLCGLILLLGATLCLCFSKNIPMLIIGRILQGMSGSMTWAVGLALVIDTVDSKNVGKAVGWTSTAMTGGILLGPLTGGVVYDRAGYYPVYAICFGLLVIDIFLRLVIIEVKDAKKWEAKRLEALSGGALTAPGPDVSGPADSVSATMTSSAISGAEKGKQGSTKTTQPAGTFDLTGPNGILGMLRKPRLLAALLGTFVESCIQTSFDATLPLVVEDTFHWEAIGAGLIFLPIIVPTFIGPIVGSLSDRYGPRWFAAGGFLFATPFLVCLRFVNENTIQHKIMLCGFLAGAGLGFAMVFAPLMAEISWAVEADEEEAEGEQTASPYAQAYALYTMAFSGGAIAGPLMGGMIRDTAGFGTVGWSMAILTAVTAVVEAIWIGGKESPRVKREATQESSVSSAFELRNAAEVNRIGV